jgi:hypothetical protein
MQAYRANPNLDTLKLVADLLYQAGRTDTALEFLEQERSRHREKPVARKKWRQTVDLLIQNIRTRAVSRITTTRSDTLPTRN